MSENFGPEMSSDDTNEHLLSDENEKVWMSLLELAKNAVNTELPINEDFIDNLDSVAEHEPMWHQFGIISHTKKFVDYLQGKVYDFIKDKPNYNEICEKMSEMIDGKPKSELLITAGILHDIGKFARGEKNGRPDYNGHEKLSEELIENEYHQKLIDTGFTDDQIEYIAKCAGVHYKLAAIRGQNKDNYNMSLAKSEACQQQCKKIIENDPNFCIEIGLLFLADSLSKTDIVLHPNNDEELEVLSKQTEPTLEQKGLPKELINAIHQVPVNLSVISTYFDQLEIDGYTSKEIKNQSECVAIYKELGKGSGYWGYEVKKPNLLPPEENLHDRGEWHITIIRPTEYKYIKESHPDCPLDIQFKTSPECLGIGKADDGDNRVYFVVVDWPEAQEYRKKLGLSHQDFHITIGFRKNDIFEIPKDKTTIIESLPEDFKLVRTE